MAILRNQTKLLSPPSVVNLTSIAVPNATNIDGSYSDPQAVSLIPANAPLSTTSLMKLIQDLVYNDEQLNAEAGALLPLLNEGVFYTRDIKDINQVSFYEDLQLQTITYPADDFTIGNGLVKIQNTVLSVPTQTTFTVGTNFSNITNPGYYKYALIEIRNDGTFIITQSPETLEYPIVPSKADRTNNEQLPVYYAVLQEIAGNTKIIYVQRMFDDVGFAQLRRHENAIGFSNKDYSTNIFEFFRGGVKPLTYADGSYLRLLDAQASTTNVVDEFNPDFNDITGEGIGFVPNGFSGLTFNNPAVRYDIYSPTFEINNPITSALPYPTFIDADDTAVISTNGWFQLESIANNLLGNTTVAIKEVKLAVKVGEEGTEDISTKVVRYAKLTHASLPTGIFSVNSATANSLTIVGTPEFTDIDYTDDFGGINQIVDVGDFVFVTSGAGKGISAKIATVSALTLTFDNNFVKTIDNTSEFVIYKTSNRIDVSSTKTLTTAELNSAVWDEFDLGGDTYKIVIFDFSLTPFNITVGVNYFILNKLNPLTIVTSPKILLEDPSSSGTHNVFNIVSYNTPGGDYPIDGGDTFILQDRFGDLAVNNGSRAAFYGINNWTIVARDLSDNRLEAYDLAGFDTLINPTECWVDVLTARVAFNSTTIPSELFANYVYYNIVSNTLSTKSIYSEGLEQSLEDYLLDKYPDGKNSGLAYIKKLIGQVNSTNVITGGYNGIMFEDAELNTGVNIELTNNSEIISLPKEITSIIENVSNVFIGWNFEYVVGTGSVSYPEFKKIYKNSKYVLLTFTYDVDNKIIAINFQYSDDAEVTYTDLGTINFTYSGTKIVSGEWS